MLDLSGDFRFLTKKNPKNKKTLTFQYTLSLPNS